MTRKAIQIRYLSPTNTKGSRLKAFTDAKSITEPLDYEMNIEDQAFALAVNYVHRMGWNRRITGFGGLPNGDFVATLGDY